MADERDCWLVYGETAIEAYKSDAIVRFSLHKIIFFLDKRLRIPPMIDKIPIAPKSV